MKPIPFQFVSFKVSTKNVPLELTLDASNLILVYDSDTRVPCLGTYPSSSTGKDPLEIQRFKSSNSYNVSVFYHGNNVLLIESPTPVLGRTAIFATIAILLHELEYIMVS